MSAMPDELAAVLADAASDRITTVGGREFHQVRRGDRDAVLVVSRIGKVAAATTAAILLERFGCDAIVFTGLAGAVAPHLRVGDVVIAHDLLQHDLDARPLFPRWEVPLLGTARFATDPALRATLAAAARGFVASPPADLAAVGVSAPVVHEGLVVSGDRFFSSAAAVADLRADLPDALAVEMEGAAVAQVCHEHGVPFAIARVISDTADHTAAIDFARFLRVACAPYARALVAAVL